MTPLHKCFFLPYMLKSECCWDWNKISIVFLSPSYMAIIWGSLRLPLVGGLLHVDLFNDTSLTLSCISPLILHPDLLWHNSSSSKSEYAFHLFLQSHQALPTGSHTSHTHSPSLASLVLYPSCVGQMEPTKERTNGVKVF